ncbi:lipase-like domain-containing protein [Staphylococcus aureus]
MHLLDIQIIGLNKFKVIEELKKQGYNVHQASVSAFGSNYDRAVELYYYIKRWSRRLWRSTCS